MRKLLSILDLIVSMIALRCQNYFCYKFYKITPESLMRNEKLIFQRF